MTTGLVGQGQITTFTSPVNGTSPIDANTVRGNDNTLKTAFNVHDADPTVHFQSSLESARPPAGIAGRKWLDTDTGRVFYDDGATWNELPYMVLGDDVELGDVTIDGTLTVDGPITVTSGTPAAFIINGPSGAANRAIEWQTDGVKRWQLRMSGNAESGANAGTDMVWDAFADDGTTNLGQWFFLRRSNGQFFFTGLDMVLGPDPGGAALLRVGGRFKAEATLSETNHALTNLSPTGYGLAVRGGDTVGTRYALDVSNVVGTSLFTVTHTKSSFPVGAVVIGTDPGGAESLRVGGTTRLGSDTGVYGTLALNGPAPQLIYAVSPSFTNARTIQIANAGGNATVAIEGAASGGTLSGASPYAMVIGTSNARGVEFFTNNAKRLVIDPTGAVVVNGYLDVTGPFGLLIGEKAGRRRLQSEAADRFTFLSDADGVADLKIRNLIALGGSSTFPNGSVVVGTDPGGPAALRTTGLRVEGSTALSASSGAGMLRIGVGVDVTYAGGAGFEFTYSTATNAGTITMYDRAGAVLKGLEISASTIKLVGLGAGTGLISVGAADSGGAGFRMLRVPN